MLTGGTEAAVIPSGIGGFIACKALSRRNDAPEAASRPWDKGRDGFVMGEGAGAYAVAPAIASRFKGGTATSVVMLVAGRREVAAQLWNCRAVSRVVQSQICHGCQAIRPGMDAVFLGESRPDLRDSAQLSTAKMLPAVSEPAGMSEAMASVSK